MMQNGIIIILNTLSSNPKTYYASYEVFYLYYKLPESLIRKLLNAMLYFNPREDKEGAGQIHYVRCLSIVYP